MNKKVGLFLSALLLSSLIIGVVSAAPTTGSITDLISSVINGVLDISKSFLSPLLGGTAGDTSDEIVAKILFFFILLSLIYVVLDKSLGTFFDEHRWPLWIISVGVPIVGLRFLPSGFVYTMILSNEAFAVTAISIIPFALMFFMSFDWHSFARRSAWILYAVVFFALYLSRSSSGELGTYYWIYPVAALLAVIMAFADGTISGIKNKWRISQANEGRKDAFIMQMQLQIEQVERASNRGANTAYRGTTARGRGKTGMDAYLADLEYWNSKIAKA